MDFNVNKCGIMHIGKSNLDFQYQMNDGWIKSVDDEIDFGVLMYRLEILKMLGRIYKVV